VPVRHSQCATYYHHMIFATVMNISSDLLLIAIPVPLIIKVNLPLKRKVVVLCVLCIGIFNVIATALNRYYNFAHPNDITYINWYVGEVSTAVYASNAPLIWPVVRKIFGLNSWWEDSGNLESSRQSTKPRRRRSPDDSIMDLDRTESHQHITDAASIGGDSAIQLEPTYRKGFKASVDSSGTRFRTDDEILDEHGSYHDQELPQASVRDFIEIR